MAGERRVRILSLLAGDGTPELATKRLCEVCADVTGMTGAGIMLMSGDIHRGSVCTTNEVSALVEQLQYALSEGPCVDAYHHDQPVLEPDLVEPATPRWPAFAGPAIAAGVRAIFGFPLHVGAIRLGALNLYCDRSGQLTDEQYADALTVADIAAEALLVLQTNAPPGELAAELEAGANFEYVVHQASGMVAVQRGESVAHALIRLKAYAFGNGRPLSDVAQDVVDRALRFDPRGGEEETEP